MLSSLGITPRKFSFEPTQTKNAVKTTIAEDVTSFKFYLPCVLEHKVCTKFEDSVSHVGAEKPVNKFRMKRKNNGQINGRVGKRRLFTIPTIKQLSRTIFMLNQLPTSWVQYIGVRGGKRKF